MKKLKMTVCLLLAALLCVALSACGTPATSPGAGGGGTALTEQELQSAMETALKNLSAVENMHVEGNTVMSMSMGDQESNVTMDFAMDSYSDPFSAYMRVTAEGETMDMYMQQEGDLLHTYMGDGDGWYRQDVDATEYEQTLKQYDAQGNLDTLMKYAKDFKLVGTEEVNGVQAYRIEGVITAEHIQEALRETGSDQTMAGVLGDDAEGSGMSLFDGVRGMPLIMWVQTDTLYPVRYQLSMTEMMQDVMNNLTKVFGSIMEEGSAVTEDPAATATGTDAMDSNAFAFAVKEVTVTMDMSKFNELPAFTLPQEVKDAPAMDSAIEPLPADTASATPAG